LNQGAPTPDLIVYLHRSVPSLLKQIELRGRSFEKDIKEEYLEGLQHAYFEYFKSVTSFPILIVNADQMDVLGNDGHYEEMKRLISREYQPGLHRISFVS
jgi:deoxyguanosine kinase